MHIRAIRIIYYTHTFYNKEEKKKKYKVNWHNGNESIARKIETLCQWLSSEQEKKRKAEREELLSCRLHVDLFSLICIFGLVTVRGI